MIKKILILSALFIVASEAIYGQDNAVEQLFTVKCGICHTIGSGRLVGPDLLNVQDRRSEEWLLEYVRSSQSMIKSGDPDAVAIFEEYNKVIMPDPMISDAEIQSVLAYITEKSASGGGGVAYVSILDDATSEDAAHGKQLYEGRERFENGGPSCISCHNINRKMVSYQTNIAKDVMASFGNLGEAGVSAILASPPFPVMAAAFAEHELTDVEKHDVLAYLRDGGAKAPDMGLSSMYSNFLALGITGGALLFVFYSLFWFNRKGDSVNSKIYRRQIKSIN